MISIPKTYPKLSSVAQEFLAREYKIERPKFVPPYEYLGTGANLLEKSEAPESNIHTFLSQTALAKNVAEEFGKVIDVLG